MPRRDLLDMVDTRRRNQTDQPTGLVSLCGGDFIEAMDVTASEFGVRISLRDADLESGINTRSVRASPASASRTSADRCPCFHAFMHDRALPSGVDGPRVRSHGRVRWVARRREARPSSDS